MQSFTAKKRIHVTKIYIKDLWKCILKGPLAVIIRPQLKLIEEMHHIPFLLFTVHILTKPVRCLSLVYPIDHVFECR